MRILVFVSLGLVLCGAATSTPGQVEMASGPCAPGWDGPFGVEPGVGSLFPTSVNATAVFDDGLGDGPVLYVGGSFQSAGGQPTSGLARWDGTAWSGVGTVTGAVRALSVYDDGQGEALYIGGTFSSIGGVPANHLARWDGATITEVGGGVDDAVHALSVWEFFAGDILLVGGEFTTAGAMPASRIATWDGSIFFPLGDGFDDTVYAVAGFGPAIFAGGAFTMSGANAVNHVARWTGTWNALSGGADATVRALLVADVGDGFDLHVGGDFDQVGPAGSPLAANSVAKWDFFTSTWDSYGAGTTQVWALGAWDAGNGPELYVGEGVTGARRWDGVNWVSLGTGLDSVALSFTPHDDGSGEKLWVGGLFSAAGGQPATSVAAWDGGAWSATSVGLNDFVFAMHATLLGGGGLPMLYISGLFDAPGQVGETGLVGWQDGDWVSLGGAGGFIQDFIEYNDGSGPALYAGGFFSSIGGFPVSHLARFSGGTWSEVGGGAAGANIETLAVWDDGGGADLYIGGSFGSFGGGAGFNGLARWDGTDFTPVGNGVTGQVRALAVYDDGSGEALYVGGLFSAAGGVPADNIARWDGSNWSALAGGVGGLPWAVESLATFDDGGGSQLYVGGSFQEADGLPDTSGIARWDGSVWSALPGGGASGVVYALQTYHDGSGPALYIGGGFNFMGGQPAGAITRYDGAMSTLGQGIPALVSALEVFDDGSGSGPHLIAGGNFQVIADALPESGSYMARWGGCWDGVDNWTDLGFALAGITGDPLLVGTGSLAPDALNHLDLSNAAPSAMAALFYSFSSTPVPFAGGTLVPNPSLTPIFVTTSPLGTLPLPFLTPPGLPSGLQLFLQWGIDDTAAIAGVALSNTVRGDVP